MMKKLFIILFTGLFFLTGYSQKIQNVDFDPNEEGEITITYDIENANTGQTFDIELFYTVSNDGWKKIAQNQLEGDIGYEINAEKKNNKMETPEIWNFYKR